MEINWEELNDEELDTLVSESRRELLRRRNLVHALTDSPELTDAYMATTNREPGAEFVQPTGAHNAYPLGWIVTFNGIEWEATRDGAHEVPGESPDWRQVAEEGEILAWVRPHAGSEYEPGVLVTHEGHVWRNDHTSPNGWEPGTTGSQWTDLGPIEDYESEQE